MFKKFKDFLLEKEKDPKDIEEAMPESPKIDPLAPKKCSKCGSYKFPCKCYTEDYYDAKSPQNTPRPSIKTPKKKKDERQD